MMFASAPRPRLARKGLVLGLLGIPLTGIWLALFFLLSPVYIYPRGLGGILLCLLIYGWPLYVMILLARRCPEEVRAKCFQCDWKETYRIETPKL